MNKLFYTLLLLFSVFSASGQDLNGTFSSQKNSITINGNRLSFSFFENGNMLSQKMGEGTYTRMGDFYLVKTESFSGKKTVIREIDSSSRDSVIVKVQDEEGFTMVGALVELLQANGKSIIGNSTNEEGRVAFLKKDGKINKIRVYNMGYDDTVISYNTAKDYLVLLSKNDVIEEQTVVFRITQAGDDAISAMLLSSNFSEGKNTEKELNTLAKKADKKNYLPVQLKREYTPSK